MPTMPASLDPVLLGSVLKDRFGLHEFRPKQKEVIDHVLNGEHTLALLPTGYGKSLCYQVPSQVLPGITLVVSPLIALMRDQVEGLRKRGIANATFLNSSNSIEEQDERIAGIKSGKFKLVYVAPERFKSARFRALLEALHVSLLVIDEAHCISHWGHDFRPQYRSLSSYLKHFPAATILALTATATPITQRDIIQSLNLPQMRTVIGSCDRPNLHFEIYEAGSSDNKDRHLINLLSRDRSSAIVYVSTRKEAERVSHLLKQERIQSAFYHAELSPAQRERAQHDFQADKLQAIVCTVAFGMGVDKPNIRRVVHYNLPGSLESYYQEAGRAGRDGQPAVCTLIYHQRDIQVQLYFLERNYPDASGVLSVFRAIDRNGPHLMHPSQIAERCGLADAAVNSALDLLKHNRLVDATADGEYYKQFDKAGDPAIDMTHMLERRNYDRLRLEKLVGFARRHQCRRAAIMDYFGQSLPGPCSGCDVCSNHGLDPTPSVKQARGQAACDLAGTILAAVKDMNARVGRTTIASVLKGGRSKKLLDNRWNKSPHYARLSGHKTDRILSSIDQLIKQGHLRLLDGLYPTVAITASGEQFLANEPEL